MNAVLNDSFMNPARFGYAVVPFKLDGEREARCDIPQWRINRSNARSMGKRTYMHTKPCKACDSLERRVWNNECFQCFQLGDK
jgi:hypothetical protein